MKVVLDQVGKRFINTWIFRNISCEFKEAGITAILGPNGSGKSTLLKIIAAYLKPSLGNIQWLLSGESMLSRDQVYKHLSWSAPYIHLPDYFTVMECIGHYRGLQKLIKPYDTTESVLEAIQLAAHRDKKIIELSSGMRQRLKLFLSMHSEVPLILLDEPATNLDREWTQAYRKWLQSRKGQATILIASNTEHEYRELAEGLVHLGF